MQLLPSISIIGGRTARLQQGNIASEKIYDVSPLEVAKQFEDHGIHQIHLVDLDGAWRGSPVNYETLSLIRGYTNLEINFAGGIQTDGDVLKAFESGATTICAGTVAVREPELFKSWIMSYGREKIMLSADIKSGVINVSGWQQSTQLTLE
jgi:phosphoribosylformimino-5-aminoimidazole carboxamide ribotide isomerase